MSLEEGAAFKIKEILIEAMAQFSLVAVCSKDQLHDLHLLRTYSKTKSDK